MLPAVMQSGLVVMIASKVDNSLTFLGTGFVCNAQGYVLTCAHILDLTAHLQITVPPPINEFHPLTSHQVSCVDVIVSQIDAENDVALLKISTDVTATISPNFLGKNVPIDVGTAIACFGIPFGDRGLHTLKLTSTIICGKSLTEKGSKRFHLDANMHQGNSGGPVLIAQTGQVVGIVSDRFSPVGSGGGIMIGDLPLGADSTISFAIPIEYGIALMVAEGINV